MNTGNSHEDRRVIDRHVFVPHYLAVLANGMIWSQSRFYLERYGAGINEVRLITVIAHSPGLTAKGLCGELMMNKSIVSRSIAELIDKKLIFEEKNGKSRQYFLTDAGYDLNGQIVKISLERERRLLSGFSPNDKTILLGYLARMFDNLGRTIDLDQMAADAGGSGGA
jgi:DNA-binding MarR family transcriptional regulator